MSSVPEDRISPLVLAASIGYLNGVRLLVERGKADIMQSVGPNQETALHAAIRCDSLDIIIYLLKVSRYALLEKPDEAGSTPLHYACMSGKTRLVTLLIRDCRVDPSPQDIKGETPLHYAVRHQRPKVIARLVGELGVYPNPYILKQVPTPLDLARSGGLKSISSYLKQNGAKTTKEMEKAISGNIISSGSSSSSSSSERSKPNSIKQKILSNKPSLVLKNKFGGLLSGLLS
ncbi:ankyrin repeat-containing domain protein [Phycomyces blakesleeanus]|uniref:Ankyrin repeat-containing domain protein n=1 Tax=Phycomyces blakesleeanus TaxID=4837 RepID=A0ABR3B027_PHYBL